MRAGISGGGGVGWYLYLCMDRDTLIEIIVKLAGGAAPVERYVLLTQLRAQCGRRRRVKRGFGLGWIPLSREAQKSMRKKQGDRIKDSCVGCKYDLDGLEQVWIDEVFVGPAVCPECGVDYPAVGE